MSNDVGNWLENFFELNPDAVEEEVETTKKKSTLTLEMELPAMDCRNKNFYKDLSDEHKKEISLWILMRWMSSSANAPEHHLMMVNDLVNHNFQNLYKHPELQWKLLAICGTGRKQSHPWIPPPKGAKKNRLQEAILKIYPLMQDDDLELFMSLNTTEDFKQFFRDNGHDDLSIKELLKGNDKK